MGNIVESNTRDVAPHAIVPWPAHQQKIINSFSHALLVAGPPENDFLVAAKKPANSRQRAESQLDTAPSNEMLRASPVAAEALEHRQNVFTHTLLQEMGQLGTAF